MDVLLDTHALVWWLSDPQQLSKRASAIIASSDNAVMVSAATAWELAIKVNLGKLDALSFVIELGRHTVEEGFVELPINMQQATRAGLLPLHHRDPFDRLLVAQAQSLNIPILSADTVLDRYDVKRVW
ncbi:MAG TPA: type II toxin-antitoxin system VapC family toxin [Terriglobales bacterium]|nr:type II toxin-antitoxin system VapC family toxin [Terriglobales bacterium]